MTGNQTPHRMTWEQQMNHDKQIIRQDKYSKLKRRLRWFCEDLIAVSALAIILVVFLVFTI